VRAKTSKFVRVKVEFIVHLDREIPTIPFTSTQLGDVLDAAAGAAVKALGSKGFVPGPLREPDEMFAASDEAARQLKVTPVAYTDGAFECGLFFPKRRR
jgi:hypothetical protein